MDQAPLPSTPTPGPRSAAWRGEWPFALAAATAVAFWTLGDLWLETATSPLSNALAFGWLFVAILFAAIRVVHHAECLASRLGEPYGTLILTLAVTTIEVLTISAVTLHADNNPTLARDAMFAVVMIVLNGLVGLSLLLGALRYREQTYNLQGTSAYLSVILTLTVLSLVLPDMTVSTRETTLSAFQSGFLVVTSIALYGTFVLIQTRRHSAYFADPLRTGDVEDSHNPCRSSGVHAALLLLYLLAVTMLTKKLAIPIDHGISDLGLPAPLGGLAVAILVLTPEGLSAIRAALGNRLQRAMNIALGSVLATIGLTVPAVLALGLLFGQEVVLGLSHADVTLLCLTLAVSIVTFSSTRTNVLMGAVHLILFMVYLMLLFAP